MVTAGVTWMLYGATAAEGESSRRVIHTQHVLRAIAEVDEELSHADAAQRGFLMTGLRNYVVERDQAYDKVRDRLQQIRALTIDNRLQQARVATIFSLVGERTQGMQENQRIREREGFEGVLPRVLEGEGQRASARITDETNVLRQEEMRLLDSRQRTAAERRARTVTVLNFTVVAMLLVLIPGYVGFAMQARARRRSERNVRLMANSLPGVLYQTCHPLSGGAHFAFLGAAIHRVRGLAPTATPTREMLMEQILPDDRPAYEAAVGQATRMMQPFSIEYRVRLPDGPIRWMHHEATPIRDDDGSVLINGYMSDVTDQHELKLALEQARQAADAANRAKSTFLATMSHEIRTPMNAVLGMLELLSMTRLDAEQRATLAIVQQSGRSLLRIIDDVLDFSKIEAGRLDVRPEATSIADLVESVFNIYSGNASSKGLRLEHNVDPRIGPSLMVDSLRLRQILSNLASNAIKFTATGSVTIAATLVARSDEGEHVRFSVTDSGRGIDPADQQRLFEPFTQVASIGSIKSGGTGLGLAICRRLASMMGGTIDMVSEIGRGTTMTVDLVMPVANDHAVKPQPPEVLDRSAAAKAGALSVQFRRNPPSIEDAEREGTLVLLVDDHPTNLMLLERQVQMLGYATETAVDGRVAFNKWKSGRYALVITDCNMPVMDGYALARAIRGTEAEEKTRRTTIVACTANALRGEAEHCFGSGMDDYLVKPATLAQILGKLDRWLPLPPQSAESAPARDQHGAPLVEAGTGRIAVPPFDHLVLAGLTGGNGDIEQAVLANFRRVNNEDATMLERAVGEQSISDVTRSAHRMKGACRMIGANALAAVAEVIEHASRNEDWSTVRSNMSSFDAERVRLDGWIDALQR